jgi:hypothetical protein
MAGPTFVQGCQGFSIGSGTTATAAFGSNNTSGNLLVVGVLSFAKTAVPESYGGVSVSDSQYNTYHSLINEQYLGGGVTVAIFYCLSCAAGANTVTLTSGTPNYNIFLVAHEVAGDAGKVWTACGWNFATDTASGILNMTGYGNFNPSPAGATYYTFVCSGMDSDNQQPSPYNTPIIWNNRQFVQNTTPINTGSTTTGGAALDFYGSLTSWDSLTGGIQMSQILLADGRPLWTWIGCLGCFANALPTLSVPVATPAAGTYTGPQSVALVQAQGKPMYYTTNGTTPTTASTLYSGPITVSANMTINVLAHDSSMTYQDVYGQYTYYISPAPPPDSNITISWERRTRISGAWLDGQGTVPLSEESEVYDLEIWDDTGSNLIRSALGLTSKSFLYTSGMQYQDFGAYKASVYVKVYQKSAVVGRGFAGINPTCGIDPSWNSSGNSGDASSIQGIPVANVTPTDGQILQYVAGSGAWVPRGPMLKRITTSKTTGSIANNTSENGSWNVGCGTFVLLKIQVDRACRVELYSTAAFQSADSSRAYNTPPTAGAQNGIICDFGFTTGETWVCSPDLLGSNGDSSPADLVYYNITNLSGSTSTVTVTLTIVPLEVI